MRVERFEGYGVGVGSEALIDEETSTTTQQVFIAFQGDNHQVVVPLSERGIELVMEALAAAKAKVHSGIVVASTVPPVNGIPR